MQNYPSLTDWNPDTAPVSWVDREFDVVFVGAISPFRVRFILETVNSLAAKGLHVKWLFVGMDKEAEQWLRSNCKVEFFEQHFVVVHRVPYRVVLGYLGRSRIGFNHHTLEKRFLVAIPNKVFEYALMGLPIVTTALPELTRVFTNQQDSVLVNSQDPGLYAQAISALLNDGAAAQAVGRAGQTLVMTRLNWEHSEAAKLVSFYKELLEDTAYG